MLGAASPYVAERRVKAGVEAYQAAGCSKFVVTGGMPRSKVPEAEAMAGIARRLGVPDSALRLEAQSRNTWENIGNSLPLLEGAERVYVVSDALHARRGRRYLCRRAADRCPQAFPYGHYIPWERPVEQWFAAWHEVGAYVKYR